MRFRIWQGVVIMAAALPGSLAYACIAGAGGCPTYFPPSLWETLLEKLLLYAPIFGFLLFSTVATLLLSKLAVKRLKNRYGDETTARITQKTRRLLVVLILALTLLTVVGSALSFVCDWRAGSESGIHDFCRNSSFVDFFGSDLTDLGYWFLVAPLWLSFVGVFLLWKGKSERARGAGRSLIAFFGAFALTPIVLYPILSFISWITRGY